MLGFEVFACLVLSCGCGVAMVDMTNDAMLFGRCENCDVPEVDEASMMQTNLQKGDYVRYVANLMNKDDTGRSGVGAGGEEHHEAFHEIWHRTDDSDASIIDRMTQYVSDAGTMDTMDKPFDIIRAGDVHSSSNEAPSGFQADYTDTLHTSRILAELADSVSTLEHAEHAFSLTGVQVPGQLATELPDAVLEQTNPTNSSELPDGFPERTNSTNNSWKGIENNRSNVSDLALTSRDSIPTYLILIILFASINACAFCMCICGGGLQGLREDAGEIAECCSVLGDSPLICCTAYSYLKLRTRILLLFMLEFAVCGTAFMWDRGILTKDLLGSDGLYIFLVIVVLLCATAALFEIHDRARDRIEPQLDAIEHMHKKLTMIEDHIQRFTPGVVQRPWNRQNQEKTKGGCC